MILDKIVEDKKIRLVEHKSRISMTEMRKMAESVRHIRQVFMRVLQNRESPLSENSKRLHQVSGISTVRLI